MRVLIAHNSYQQPGGEDRVAAAEGSLLEQNGHEVIWFRRHNDAVSQYSATGMAMRTIWNRAIYSELRALLRRTRPSVCHVHNTFPLMSPAVFYAARAERIPVVLTVHNYRLLCPGSTFLRGGAVCQDCLSKTLPWPGVWHACYRHSRPATAATAAMLAVHRLAGTWRKAIGLYVAPAAFTRRKLIEGGLPAEKIAVKPNFLESDPGFAAGGRNGALFAGRLAPEKGIETLLDAWKQLSGPMPLRIAGDGPLAGRVAAAAAADPRIEWLGAISHGQVIDEMKRAQVLLFPSVWYEVLPLTLIEAYATGLPVIAARIGAVEEVVIDGETGLFATAGDAADLARRLSWCAQHPGELVRMGVRARQRFDDRYTAAANYQQLIGLYARVRASDCAALFMERREGPVVDSYR